MLELPVTPACDGQIPAVLVNEAQHFTDFHAVRIPLSNRLALAQGYGSICLQLWLAQAHVMTWREILDRYWTTAGSCIRTQTDAAIARAASSTGEVLPQEAASASPPLRETPAPRGNVGIAPDA